MSEIKACCCPLCKRFYISVYLLIHAIMFFFAICDATFLKILSFYFFIIKTKYFKAFTARFSFFFFFSLKMSVPTQNECAEFIADEKWSMVEHTGNILIMPLIISNFSFYSGIYNCVNQKKVDARF